ncbi:MAG TPA: class IV adenylate cyclase [Tepidisphaeraceae bacterium]|jgi:adenylate cyclase class 2|nr:class IV adenylate cyclase [Tepidisphaeraceae bacterium]
MPVEIEAKIKVNELAEVRERLQKAGANHVGEAMETNIFFDTDDRSLLAADEGLRLRQKKDLSGQSPETYTITFKGPRHPGALKSRDELELGVASSKDAVALLDRLGFHKVLTFEKKRESWKLEGCLVELDELPHLGSYVEIEGPKEDAILKVREILHLSDRPLVKASYIALLMTYLQEQGKSHRVVAFSTADRV